MKDHDCESEWCWECCNCTKCSEQAFDLLVLIKQWYDKDKSVIPDDLRVKIDKFLSPREK